MFAGIWRVCEFDADGGLCGDWIEAGALPEIVLQAAHAAAAPAPVAGGAAGGGNEFAGARRTKFGNRARDRKQGAAAHVINLTLFPMTPEDHAVLEQALPVGPVAIISRGFGNCRITSTLVRDVWRVQYFNSMNTLILNTLEIVEAPEVALAAAEDLLDSRERLAELIAWMGESCTASKPSRKRIAAMKTFEGSYLGDRVQDRSRDTPRMQGLLVRLRSGAGRPGVADTGRNAVFRTARALDLSDLRLRQGAVPGAAR